MLTYEMIKALCRKKGVTITATEKALGFSRGSLCKVQEKAKRDLRHDGDRPRSGGVEILSTV